MGIQINGQTDTISAVDGALTVGGADLPTVTNLNATGIVTATGFVGNVTGNLSGNVTGNINATGVSTIATLNVAQSNPTNLNVSGVTTVSVGSTSAPSISPSGDSNTGIFFPSADTIAFGEGGVEAARFDSNGKLLSPAGAAFVGNVSSTGNGAIMESGSNANGEFVKYADGTLICTRIATFTFSGSEQSSSIVITWPSPFIDTNYGMGGVSAPVAHGDLRANITHIFRAGSAASNFTTSSFTAIAITRLGATYQTSMSMIAIGRWF